MIDAIRQHLLGTAPHQRMNALREYLQWLILQSLDDAGIRGRLIFTGGTCLRVVYGIRRFSEDLDFSLAASSTYDPKTTRGDLLRRLRRLGLQAEAGGIRDRGAVASFFIRIPGILHALEISSLKKQKISIRIEVDRNPPAGGTIREFFFPDPVPFLVNHYDPASLFALKLHAFLFRGFEKGRDVYDLLHFLGKKVTPDLSLFRAAVRQTDPEMEFPTRSALREAVRRKVQGMDEARILRDVGPFLLDPAEERFLTREVLLRTLDQGSLTDDGGIS